MLLFLSLWSDVEPLKGLDHPAGHMVEKLLKREPRSKGAVRVRQRDSCEDLCRLA